MSPVLIVAIIIVAVAVIGGLVYRFLRSEVVRLFREIVRALSSGAATIEPDNEKPRSLSDMTSILLPRIQEDFPGFSLDVFYDDAKAYAMPLLEKEGTATIHKMVLNTYDRKSPEKTITIQMAVQIGSGESKKQYRYILEGRNRDLVKETLQEDVTVLNCPNCGAPLEGRVSRCRYCGTAFRNLPRLHWIYSNLHIG